MGKLFGVYDPFDGLTTYETLKEAEEEAESAFNYYADDGVPEEYIAGGLLIVKILKASHCPVVKKREDYREKVCDEEPCPYGDDDCDKCWQEAFDTILDFEMVDVDGADGEVTDVEKALNFYKIGAFQRNGNYPKPEWVPVRVKVLKGVRSDNPISNLSAVPDEYDCECNQYGAVFVEMFAGRVSELHLNEFEVLEWGRNPAFEREGEGRE